MNKKLLKLRADVRALERAEGITSPSDVRRGSVSAPTVPIKTFAGPMRVEAAVSPDCSYRVLEKAIRSARSEMLLYIYNLSSKDLADALLARMADGVGLSIMYDARDTQGNELDRIDELRNAGAEVKIAPSTGSRTVFAHCHQKFLVVDDATVVVQSANWAGTAFPKVISAGGFKAGNREWVLSIAHPPLAAWFRQLFETDWNIPERRAFAVEPVVPALELETMLATRAPGKPSKVFDSKSMQLEANASITPIISPQNYFERIYALIEQARTSVDVQQQYIRVGGPKIEGILALLKKRRNQIRIRLMASPAFKESWDATVRTADLYALKPMLKAMRLDHYKHLHNKGVLIDDDVTIVSSTNWSESSITKAREAGVEVRSKSMASYYQSVFNFDWSQGWAPRDTERGMRRLFSESWGLRGEPIANPRIELM